MPERAQVTPQGRQDGTPTEAVSKAHTQCEEENYLSRLARSEDSQEQFHCLKAPVTSTESEITHCKDVHQN